MSLNFVSAGTSKPNKFGEYSEAKSDPNAQPKTEIDPEAQIRAAALAEVLQLVKSTEKSKNVNADGEDEGECRDAGEYIPDGLLPLSKDNQGVQIDQTAASASGKSLYEQLKQNQEAESETKDVNPAFQAPKSLDDDEIDFLDGLRAADRKKQEEERVSDDLAIKRFLVERDAIDTTVAASNVTPAAAVVEKSDKDQGLRLSERSKIDLGVKFVAKGPTSTSTSASSKGKPKEKKRKREKVKVKEEEEEMKVRTTVPLAGIGAIMGYGSDSDSE